MGIGWLGWPVMVRASRANRSASWQWKDRLRGVGRVMREVAVPGDELAAFAVAADPFQLAALGPFGGHFGGGREFDGGVRRLRDSSRSIVARFGWQHSSDVVRWPVGRRSGSMCQAAMPSRSKSATSIVRTAAPVLTAAKWAAMGSRSTPMAEPLVCEREQVAADAAAEVGDDRGRERRGSLQKRAALYAATHSSVACSRPMRVKNMRCGVGKLCGRAAAQLDLLEQQMRLGRAKACRGGGRRPCEAVLRRRQARRGARRLRRRSATRNRQASLQMVILSATAMRSAAAKSKMNNGEFRRRSGFSLTGHGDSNSRVRLKPDLLWPHDHSS